MRLKRARRSISKYCITERTVSRPISTFMLCKWLPVIFPPCNFPEGERKEKHYSSRRKTIVKLFSFDDDVMRLFYEPKSRKTLRRDEKIPHTRLSDIIIRREREVSDEIVSLLVFVMRWKLHNFSSMKFLRVKNSKN